MIASSAIICAKVNVRRKRVLCDSKERTKALVYLVWRGMTRYAIRCACERDKSGTLMRGGTIGETKDLTSETLASKHPEDSGTNTDNSPLFEIFLDLSNV